MLPRPHPRRIVVAYLALQSAAIGAWWTLLLLVPEAASWFQPDAWPREALLAFWLADLGLLGVGSACVAALVAQRRTWAGRALLALSAAAWYAALFSVGSAALTGEAWAAASLMVAMAGLTLALATVHGIGDQAPAAVRATSLEPRAAIGWTLAQTAIFWGAFLWVLPLGLVEVEELIGVDRFAHPGQSAGAIALFATSSGLGLWSGVTMARIGRGTPLPTATAPRLVERGPYALVRNPMALAGITQGLSVGWRLGSPAVIAYSISGAVLWHLAVRPVEEADLGERFGPAYASYCANVGLWLPRWRPWRGAGGDVD